MNAFCVRLLVLLLLSCSACESPAPEQTSDIGANLLGAQDTTTITVDTSSVAENRSSPVVLPPDYDTSEWTDVARLDSTILMDIRYATSNNFVEMQMYECGRCFLRPEVANAIHQAHQRLQQQGLGLKMYDCYRPRPIQWKLWEKVPDPRYVSDPRKGSMHNRGAAVDLTIVDKDGNELDMGTDFDFFGRRAYTTNTALPPEILNNRKLLQNTLVDVGFRYIRTEWWHFAYTRKRYALSDMLWNCPETTAL
ncbi:MAG: M15 family metallopeptidase [Bacteroidota bacterium]